MMRSASYITLSIFAILLGVHVAPVSAETSSSVSVSNNGEGAKTNVKVETNTGGNTICQNGKCTTTSNGNGKSTVCVNGVCNTSEDGDVNYESSDGNTKVNINNSESSVKVLNEVNGDQGTIVKRGTPTITPTQFKKVEHEQTEVLGATDKAKEEVKKQEGFNLFSFFQKLFESIF